MSDVRHLEIEGFTYLLDRSKVFQGCFAKVGRQLDIRL